jgi:hypothetical protein
MNPVRAIGDTARLRHRDEEVQVDQIEAHPEFRYLPSAWPNAVSVISRLCR